MSAIPNIRDEMAGTYYIYYRILHLAIIADNVVGYSSALYYSKNIARLEAPLVNVICSTSLLAFIGESRGFRSDKYEAV